MEFVLYFLSRYSWIVLSRKIRAYTSWKIILVGLLQWKNKQRFLSAFSENQNAYSWSKQLYFWRYISNKRFKKPHQTCNNQLITSELQKDRFCKLKYFLHVTVMNYTQEQL
ncbi:MAG: hypothetical protein AAFV80_21815, partial [Bacteroidota bacterium]